MCTLIKSQFTISDLADDKWGDCPILKFFKEPRHGKSYIDAVGGFAKGDMRAVEKEGNTIEKLGLANYVAKINERKANETDCVSFFFCQEGLSANCGLLLHNWDLGIAGMRNIKWQGISERVGIKNVRMIKCWKMNATSKLSKQQFVECRFTLALNLCPKLCRKCIFDPFNFCDEVMSFSAAADYNDFEPLISRTKPKIQRKRKKTL